MSDFIDRARKLAQVSVGTRIYAAVGGIMALTVAASTLAGLSFGRVDSYINDLVDQRYPTVISSLELAQAAITAVAIAPKLADVKQDSERAAIIARLAEADKKMRALVDDLARDRAVGRDKLVEIINRLRGEIGQADTAARERITIEADKVARVAQLARAQDAFNQLLVDAVDVAQFKLMLGMERAANVGTADAVKSRMQRLSENELPAYGTELTLHAELNQLHALLREVLVLDRRELLVPALDRYQALSQRVAKALRAADKTGADPRRKAVADAVVVFGTGDDSVFKLRERDFGNRDALASSLAAANETAMGLRAEVDADARGAADLSVRATAKVIGGTRLWLLMIGAASVLAAGAIALFIVRPRIVLRLQRLWAATHAIAEGRLDTEVDTRGNDEIGEIGRTVIVFRDNVRERERLVADQVLEAEADLRRATLVNEKVAEFEGKVGTVLTEVRGAAKRLEGAAVTLNRAANTVSAESNAARERIAASSEFVASAAGSTDELAASIESIATQASKTNEVAGSAVGEAQGTVKTMATLDAAAARISEVISLIEAIARQTSLLALNATIEAARAGESGKGFAVVASEVKSLATQTAKATDEVGAQIGSIQSAVGEAAAAITRVNSIIDEMSRNAANVASAAVQQNVAVNTIAEGVNRASAETRMGAEAMTRVTTASADAHATAGEVKALADTLAGEAERLDTEVRHFLSQVRVA
jgi:methyl-accepting chemotaxis protein